MDTLQYILHHLNTHKQIVCTAESCTGGLLAGELTRLPGSSAIFTHGWVTYSNFAKMQQLGVRSDTLQKYGAVSKQTVQEMANAALRIAQANYAIAISGIAGPTGGSADKPIGTVCFALCTKKQIITEIKYFPDSRDAVRQQAVEYALQLLKENLYSTTS